MSTTPVGWWYDYDQGAEGVLAPVSSIRIGPDSHTFNYGDGAFEGIRAYPIARDHSGSTRAVFRLQDHIRRLFGSARLLAMKNFPFTEDDLIQASLAVLARNNQDTYLRPIIYRGTGLGVNPNPSKVCATVISAPWGKYLAHGWHNDGVSVAVSWIRRPHPDAVPIIRGKCTANYAMNAVLKAWALELGVAEAIFRAPDGIHLSEGTGMNLVLVINGEFVTPDDASARLAGITLQTIGAIVRRYFDGAEVIARPVHTEELLICDEAFFTGTATEITPITMVDGREIGTERPGYAGIVTQRLQTIYRSVVTGETVIDPQWLTLVPEPASALTSE